MGVSATWYFSSIKNSNKTRLVEVIRGTVSSFSSFLAFLHHPNSGHSSVVLLAPMDMQISRWFHIESVPENYTFPSDERPGKLPIPSGHTIPVINLAKAATPERPETVHQIFDAGREFGVFQVINHGVSENVATETLSVFREFFDLPADKKSSGPNEKGWIYTGSTDYDRDGIHLWRENMKHPCHPLEECMLRWPETPNNYREVVAEYLREIRKLSLKVLELICEGLGLEAEYFEGLSQVQLLSANNYPPCPDPSLTLGLLKHCDPSLITIIYQGNVCGLQVLEKHGHHWITVRALPDAFVVILGNQLQIISNGKLRSAVHRAVTNMEEARISITTFINPSPNCTIEPAKVLVDASNYPPIYKPTLYKEFVHNSKAFGPDTEAISNGSSSWK